MKKNIWRTALKPGLSVLSEKFLGRKNTEVAQGSDNISRLPSVNISDEEKAFEVQVMVPGLNRKDVKVEVHDNCLLISSEKENNDESKGGQWLRREFSYHSFVRVFELPESADENRVQAVLRDGLLSISLAKKPEYRAKTKLIQVE